MTVTFQDVLAPLVVLSFCNVFILYLWSLITPVYFLRVDDERNYFGIVVESTGRCSSLDWLTFLVPLLVINGAALALACHQAYKARRVPTELNESKTVAMAMLSIFQGLFFGVPLLFLTYRSDSFTFLYVATTLIVVICIATNLFIFAPKVHAVMNYVETRTRGQQKSSIDHQKALRSKGAEKSSKSQTKPFPLLCPDDTGDIGESLPSINHTKTMDTKKEKKIMWSKIDSCIVPSKSQTTRGVLSQSLPSVCELEKLSSFFEVENNTKRKFSHGKGGNGSLFASESP